MKKKLINIILVFVLGTASNAQHSRWIKVGSLHSWFRSDGCEPYQGEGFSSIQNGLRWPVDSDYQDCLVSKGLWIGTTNYADHPQFGGKDFACKVVHCGPRHWDTKNEFIPIDFKLAGRFQYPQVSVDGMLDPELFDEKKIDIIDPSLPSDLMLINVVNTSIGITMTRKIMYWIHAEHDNYFVYDYLFTNTGNIDADPEIEQQKALQGVWFFFQYRYAPCKEAIIFNAGLPKSAESGHATMLDVCGEDLSKGDLFRAQFAWLGKHSQWQGPGDNIGAPDYQNDGHFRATQYLGVITLHADKSAFDHADDPYQPRTTHYIDSNAGINLHNDPFDSAGMTLDYAAMSRGHAPVRHARAVGEGYADVFGETVGGYSHGQGFGPYTLRPGESIHIVLAEAVDGLSSSMGAQKGSEWLNGKAPFTLPNGTGTNDRNFWKNKWIATGQDSLFKSFQKAHTNFISGFAVPSAPPPPAKFIITSGFDKISLRWSAESEADPYFSGYQVYRLIPYYRSEQPPMKVFECGPGTSTPAITHSFDDKHVTRGASYEYAVLAVNTGGNNGGIPLHSASTWTSHRFQPAYLKARQPIQADLYVSPQGNDKNSGLSAQAPLKNIGKALELILADFAEPRTIHLAPGIYSPSATGEKFPLKAKNFVKIQGADKRSTILCPEDSLWAVKLEYETQGFALENLSITGGRNSMGGAISGRTTDLALKNVILSNNAGTGLSLTGRESSLFLDNVAILDNGYSGMYISNARSTVLRKVTIARNKSYGAFFYYCQDVQFDNENRSNIYDNGIDFGANYQGLGSPAIRVALDTSTVLYPTSYHADPVAAFRFDIRHGLERQIYADLYVSPSGDDGNAGTSADKPLRTIKRAVSMLIQDSLDTRSIHLAPGVYSKSTTGEAFPIRCPSYLSIQGESPKNSILDGENLFYDAMYIYGNQQTEIKNLLIKNFKRNACAIRVSDLIYLRHLSLVNNKGDNSVRGLFVSHSNRIRIISSTIANNGAKNSSSSGGIYSYLSDIVLVNSIVWNNDPFCISGEMSTLNLAYSNLDSSKISGTNRYNWLEGSFAYDPLFEVTFMPVGNLLTSSPCIDAGTPNYIYSYSKGNTIYSELLVDIPPARYSGLAPDMGAFESNWTLLADNGATSPLDYRLEQNFPNPFNSQTVIKYTLCRRGRVSIELFNVVGQKITVLVDEIQNRGNHIVQYNASGLSAGLYFYRICAGQFTALKKMVLIK